MQGARTDWERIATVFAVFLRLGMTSFGGPIAHLGYFREAFVVRRGWLSEDAFAELVALCQFLPGPASSQVGFAIGLGRAGALGGLAAFVGFTAPSAALMLAAAAGLGFAPAALIQGLKLVAVAVVAHAVTGMAQAHCRDWPMGLLAMIVLAALAAAPWAWAAPASILFAGAVAAALNPPGSTPKHQSPGPPPAAILLLGLFFMLLIGLPAAAHLAPAPGLVLVDAFYRAGLLVFGGGHVVLPLLETETVARGWLTTEAFLAGYGAAQGLPGPLFAFAAYLGASAKIGLAPMLGGTIAILAIFTPGLLLVSAALPVWARLKAMPRARGFVRGASAGVVGVLGAALIHPVATSAVLEPGDAFVAAGGYLALMAKAPAWMVIAGVAIAGAGVHAFI